jgi:hypothetical protein
MTSYIALLRKDVDSDYGVEFPDFPGCVTAGTTLITRARRVPHGEGPCGLRRYLRLLRDDEHAVGVAGAVCVETDELVLVVHAVDHPCPGA